MPVLPAFIDPTILSVTLVLVHGIAIVTLLLTQGRQPSTTLAWLLTLVFLPGMGLLLFVLFGAARVERIRRKAAPRDLRKT